MRLLAWLTSIVSLSAQVQEPPQTTFKSGVSEIYVDVVVRDKKGRMVSGLGASDFTILENDAAQQITSFREVRRAVGSKAPATSTSGVADNTVRLPKQIRLVSLVYDRLSAEGRRLSRQASTDFLKRDLGESVYYAVFAIDRGFRVLQPYTADQRLLQAAIQRATSGERSDFTNDNQGLDSMAQANQGSEGAAAAVAQAASSRPAGGMTVDGGSLSAEQAAQVALEMSEFAANLNRDDLGRMSVFSLWAIIKEVKPLPGRKSVIYFAEGLQLPNSLQQQFDSMVSDANRANVSVYSIDARGLTISSDQGAATQMLAAAAQRSQYARNTQTESAAGNRAESRTFDLAVDSLRANAQNAMAELSEKTGGFLMANTNDFRADLQKLSEDFNAYYEITYRPSDPSYDGRFREISVKISRPDVTIQARNGYFALPPMDGETVFPYEVPLLRALSQTPLPRDLEYRAGILRFRQREGSQQVALVFDLPLRQIAFAKDDLAGKYRTHISVLALIKDDKGHVVAKLSRDVPLNEPLDKLAGFQQGRFIVTKAARLGPGRYTVESVAADQEGNRLAAKKSALVIPPSPAPLQLSDMALVRRLDKPAELPDWQDPLSLQSGRVIPTLIDTIPGGPDTQLSVFFTIYPSGGVRPKLVLDLLRDGKLITRASPEVPAPNPQGAIPYFANMPIGTLAAGQYEFRATAIEGENAAQRSLFVNLE